MSEPDANVTCKCAEIVSESSWLINKADVPF